MRGYEYLAGVFPRLFRECPPSAFDVKQGWIPTLEVLCWRLVDSECDVVFVGFASDSGAMRVFADCRSDLTPDQHETIYGWIAYAEMASRAVCQQCATRLGVGVDVELARKRGIAISRAPRLCVACRERARKGNEDGKQGD